MGDPPRSGERVGGVSPGLATLVPQTRSFAELVAVLNRVNALESAIATAISGARIPLAEVRQVLRAHGASAVEGTPAFQFLREVFAQVGLPLTIDAVGRFSWTIGVDASPYARLLAVEGPRKTCGFVSEALARFVGSDFGIPADVEEVACRNEGAPRCLFAVALDPIAVAGRALDAQDWRLLRSLAGSAPDPTLPAEELDYRMETLIGYGLVAADGRLLPDGGALVAAGAPAEEPFAPPWRDVSRLTDAIAHAASAAEALAEVAPRTVRPSDAPDADTAALAAECHSFAELLARASKGRSWE